MKMVEQLTTMEDNLPIQTWPMESGVRPRIIITPARIIIITTLMHSMFQTLSSFIIMEVADLGRANGLCRGGRDLLLGLGVLHMVSKLCTQIMLIPIKELLVLAKMR